MGYNCSAVTLQGELSQSTAPRYVISWCVLEWDVSPAAGMTLTGINKVSMFAFPKMVHGTCEGFCV